MNSPDGNSLPAGHQAENGKETPANSDLNPAERGGVSEHTVTPHLKKRRRRFKESEVIQTLILQGTKIRCHRCRKLIRDAKTLQREHLHEVELGGPDEPANCRYSHKSCHDIITNGTKATSAGSSKHRIAKARRMAKARQRFDAHTDLTEDAIVDALVLLRNSPSRPFHWPKRKIPSRPFSTKKRRFTSNKSQPK